MNDKIILEGNNIPQPSELSYKEKERSMAAYFMMFASTAVGLPLPFINFLASLIYYHFIKETSRFVKFHSHQSLISQLPVTILNGISVAWAFRNLYYHYNFSDLFWGFISAVAIANLIYIIFSSIAAIRAYNGRLYYFLFFGRLSYRLAFEKPFEKKNSEIVNRPPH